MCIILFEDIHHRYLFADITCILQSRQPGVGSVLGCRRYSQLLVVLRVRADGTLVVEDEESSRHLVVASVVFDRQKHGVHSCHESMTSCHRCIELVCYSPFYGAMYVLLCVLWICYLCDRLCSREYSKTKKMSNYR